ncbi:complement C1q-like protein 3 [Mytilus galloprovincialis]|uniref:complement C1q-like protein 3 n=1 Tax=Mytilus galloprovincialis TaxID=29158 RepID=UPI003F7C1B5A
MSLTSMLIFGIVVFYMVNLVGATTSCRTADGQYDVTVNYRGSISHETPDSKSRVIAFYAFMSKSITNPSIGRRLVFDVVKTNQGGGYNNHTGVFTCPKTGIYVFVWVVRLYSGHHSFELMINNSVYGTNHLRNTNLDSSVSSTVVAHVSEGDSVYVRIHISFNGSGLLLSDKNGRPTFSGWLLN